jgi:hypothetical protein
MANAKIANAPVSLAVGLIASENTVGIIGSPTRQDNGIMLNLLSSPVLSWRANSTGTFS